MKIWFLAGVLSLTLLAAQAGAAEKILFASDFSKGITNGWKNVELYKRKTDYSVRREGTNFFVHAAADNSCSALTKKLNLKPAGRLILRWRWRIAGVATNGSDRKLSRFDHAARVFVAFRTFWWPPRTLDYLWGNKEKVGTVLNDPMTGRVKLFIVESGNAKAGHWVSEERDVTADWRRAFPGRKMPKIEAVGILTDGDSLATKLSGDYADIELISK